MIFAREHVLVKFSEVATELYVPKTVLSVRLIERIF